MDKESIKKEVLFESNNILKKYSEPYVIDSISVMNMASKTVFLGTIKVFNEENVENIVNDLNKQLADYGSLSIRDEKVVSCCSANYVHISFNISVIN